MTFASELELTQALIQTPSPSCREAAAMTLLKEAFEALEFDEAYLDEAGNAIGIFRRGEGPTVMLNGHLDTVPLGDEALWPHPPLSADLVDGEVWGRGAVDMKAAVACMAFAAKDAVTQGFQGTLLVTAVVQEEIGGLGARYLGTTQKADVVILGEPSNLKLMLGHRGRVEIEARLPGKIAHAAKNELGDNALYHAAEFLQKLKTLELPKGGPLGQSSITPTRIMSHPESANVVPGRADVTLDYRNIPGDDAPMILERLKVLAPEAEFIIHSHTYLSENGKVSITYANDAPPYLCPGENRYVSLARRSIKESLANENTDYLERVWWFATDAPYLAQMGAPVIGFGPGNEELAHTTQERVSCEHLRIARKVYGDLALAYSA